MTSHVLVKRITTANLQLYQLLKEYGALLLNAPTRGDRQQTSEGGFAVRRPLVKRIRYGSAENRILQLGVRAPVSAASALRLRAHGS
jgi:hypothetical protein